MRSVAIDAVRGCAAILVVFHHLFVFRGEDLRHILENYPFIFALLQLVSGLNVQAVQIFFFVSGYCIARTVSSLRKQNVSYFWAHYFRKRAIRILPVYWVCLLWSWVVCFYTDKSNPALSWETFIANLLFLQTPTTSGGWFAPFAGNGPLWSLSFEVWYYATLPLMLWCARRLSIESHSLVQLFASLILALFAIGVNRLWPNPFSLIFSMWPVWVAGYIFHALALERRVFGFVAGLCAGLVLLSATFLVTNSDTVRALISGFVVCIIYSVIYAIKYNSINSTILGLFAKMSTSIVTFMAWIGSGSYFIYVMHYPLLKLLGMLDESFYKTAFWVLMLVLSSNFCERLVYNAFYLSGRYLKGEDSETIRV